VLTALRTLQNRRSQPEPAAPAAWEPIPNTTPVTVPVAEPVAVPVAVPQPQPEPVPEPVFQPGPVAAPAPVNLLQEAPAPKQAKKAPAKKAAKKKAPAAAWVDPIEGGCPSTHPVKAKLSSKIFHLPGGLNYPRTVPDRCYLDVAAAEADGLRAAKR
jgi:hypothetical protein